MRKLQLQLLESAAKVVKSGGIIIYSTCTIDPDENEGVVNAFINRNTGFRLEAPGNIPKEYHSQKYFVRTFPHKHNIDGTFAVRLKKLQD